MARNNSYSYQDRLTLIQTNKKHTNLYPKSKYLKDNLYLAVNLLLTLLFLNPF